MADNITASLGTEDGGVFATDVIGGVHYPRTKVTWGADGTATDVATSTNALPIQDGGNSLTVDGSVTVTQATGTNLHAVVDSGTITTVSTVSTITNVVHVDDNSSTLSIDDGGSTISIDDGAGSITVDGTVTANVAAGTNLIGYVLPGSGKTYVADVGTVWTVKQKSASVASSGTNAFITAVSSKRLRVLSLFVQASNAVSTTNMTIKFYDTQGSPAQITGSPQFELQAREGVRMVAHATGFLFEASSGNGIQINISSANAVWVHLEYVEEP